MNNCIAKRRENARSSREEDQLIVTPLGAGNEVESCSIVEYTRLTLAWLLCPISTRLTLP